MAQKKGVYTVQTVHNAFEILEYLAEDRAEATLQALASRFDLTQNKTFRLLSTLCESGFVEQDKPSGTYRLGMGSFSLAQNLSEIQTLLASYTQLLSNSPKSMTRPSIWLSSKVTMFCFWIWLIATSR